MCTVMGHGSPPGPAFEPQVCARLPASAHCGAGPVPRLLHAVVHALPTLFSPLFSPAPAFRSSTWLRRRGEAGCRATAPSCLRCAWPRPAPRWRAATRCAAEEGWEQLVAGGAVLPREADGAGWSCLHRGTESVRAGGNWCLPGWPADTGSASTALAWRRWRLRTCRRRCSW